MLLFISTVFFAQNVKKIEKLKDAWDLSITYTGEVKDGKPNGMGVAKYASGNTLRYVGGFLNGMYSGKGTMFFDNDAFLTGEWKNGKLNGKGSNLMASGDLYIGDFANGVKNGKGILFFKDNSVIIGSYADDKLNGRAINIWKDGNIVSDIEYRDDKRNGKGYQYEVKAKKIYEGEWRDDKWVQAATPSFSSFLKSSSFVGEMTDEHILMGATNSNHFLIDTSYYYNLKNHKRYFGKYENGNLRNGFIITDDSTRFYGPLNDKGASGYCYDFKFKKFFSEGNYTNDFLNGQIMDLDLAKKSLYYGSVVDGIFTGKAYFFNDEGTMYAGDYLKGRFTGNGYKMETNGRYTSGTWENGNIVKLASIITPEGELITGNPKSFAEGLNNIIRTYPGGFDNISGEIVLDDDDLLDELTEIDEDYDLTFTHSLVNIPGSAGKDVIADDYDVNTFYYSKMLVTDNAVKAKARYNEIAAQLQAAVITNKYLTTKQKLIGKVIPPDVSKDITESEFTISGGNSDFKYFKVWLRMRKNDMDNYVVELFLGEKTGDY